MRKGNVFNMKRSAVLWIIAVIVTLGSVFYQRLTGPTHPVRGSVEIGGEKIKYRLLRTHVTDEDARMKISASSNVSGEISLRRFKSHDEWRTEAIPREGDKLIVAVPKQPPAGKVMYRVTLIDKNTGTHYDLSDEPIIIRFKGAVPGFVIWPHVIIMFLGMLWATRTGLEAVLNGDKIFRQAVWTTIILSIGGLIFGPLLQKFAFNEWWTGWPFGHDLTDSKTAVAVIFWVWALWRHRAGNRGRFWIIVAAVVTFVIFIIPHSVLGSEIDYTKIEQPAG